MSATELALRHGRALLFLSVAAAAGGLLSARTLPKAVYPEVAFPREQVVATLDGASADAVNIALTRPLEAGLAGLPGVEQLRSKTIRGAVELSLFFSPDSDLAAGHALLLARLADLREQLPPGTSVSAERVLPSSFPILSLNVQGPYPPEQLSELALYTIRPALAGLPGVGPVTVQSSSTRELEVRLDPRKLAAAHTTATQVAERLQQQNKVQTVARLNDQHELLLAIATGELRTADDVSAALVAGTNDSPLRVSDLGTVSWGTAPHTSLIRVSGKPGAIINVARRLGGDALALDEAVHARLDSLRSQLPPGIEIVPVYEQATFVADGVRSLWHAVLFGALFAVLVLALFLRDLRATAIAALSLPLTLAASLLALRAFNQTLNLMSLGGLAIAVGLVIDDAVVVIEAVHAKLEGGASPEEAAKQGTEELFWPVIGTSLTTVVVFIPLGFLEGVAGQFFAALSISLSSAVILSLPIALGVLPGLAAKFLKPLGHEVKPSRLQLLYAKQLSRALNHPGRVVIVAALLSALGLGLLISLPTDFLPEADEGSFVIDYYTPPGASLKDADALAAQIEDLLRDTPEVAAFSRRLGAELGPPTATLASRGDVAVLLKRDRSRAVDEIIDELRGKLASRVPGLRVEFAQVLSDMLGDLQGSPEPVEVRVLGPDPLVLRGIAHQVAQALDGQPGLVDLFNGDEGCAPELELRVDSQQAGRRGLSTSAIAEQLSAPDHQIDDRVRSEPDPAPDLPPPPEQLLAAQVTTPDGALVPLRSLAETTRSCKPAALLRWNQRNEVHVTARLSGTSLGSAVKEVKKRTAGLQLPVGYQLELGGLFEQQQSGFKSLLLVLACALLAVLLVLLFQLRSFALSLAILGAAPLALAGGALALFITRTSLNVSSMMGSILLIGLVVKNGILLLDYAQLEQGKLRERLLRAGQMRLRPILMTTAATLAGLMPLVIGIGSGSELHRPLAIAVVGGLLLSTAATLFAVPALALLFTKNETAKD
jgi:multidrug efflux pump subunit AcrB